MTRLFNRKQQTGLRRRLRADAPKAERLLWWRLRGRQVADLKFRRQYGIGPYVVDFYCAQTKLAMEIDGELHFEPGVDVRDGARQSYIESLGIRVLRFTNPQVYDELNLVIEEIARVAEERIVNE